MNLSRPLYGPQEIRRIRADRWRNILMIGGLLGAFYLGWTFGHDSGVADALRGLR